MIAGSMPYKSFKERLNIVNTLQKKLKKLSLSYDDHNIYYQGRVKASERFEL